MLAQFDVHGHICAPMFGRIVEQVVKRPREQLEVAANQMNPTV
jgi:hypothetical protein